MRIKRERLQARGWHLDEIDQVMKAMAHAEKKKNEFAKFSEAFLPWLALGIALIGNFIVSYALIPFIAIIDNLNLYFLLLIVAGAFGVLFTSVVKDIDLHLRHDTLLLLIVPAVAFVNFFIITIIANTLAATTQIDTRHSPVIVGLVYVIAFLAPYGQFLVQKGLFRKPS